MEFLIAIIDASWDIVVESSVFILLGFIVAGFIHGFMPIGKIIRYLKPRNIKSIINASLLGVPLPLCSCGVLPTAAALRKQGASKGATTAFLISTPESGVDSIALTYALMDPVMTVFRPVAAFISAAFSGIAEIIFGDPDEKPEAEPAKEGGCGCSESESENKTSSSFGERFKAAVDFAFSDLMDDMAGWLAAGFLVAGLITALLPGDFLLHLSDSTFVSMLLMLAAGIPLYICATASTPIAAALILKGLNPGAALVFLLAGPATNAVAITLLYRMLGRRSVIIYLASIGISSILLGYTLNGVYSALDMQAHALNGAYSEIIPPYLEFSMAIVLCFFMARSILKSYGFKFFSKRGGEDCADSCGCDGSAKG